MLVRKWKDNLILLQMANNALQNSPILNYEETQVLILVYSILTWQAWCLHVKQVMWKGSWGCLHHWVGELNEAKALSLETPGALASELLPIHITGNTTVLSLSQRQSNLHNIHRWYDRGESEKPVCQVNDDAVYSCREKKNHLQTKVFSCLLTHS